MELEGKSRDMTKSSNQLLLDSAFISNTPEQLLDVVRSTYVKVPSQLKDRNRENQRQTESWVFGSFLREIAKNQDLLSYPLSVCPGERPDVVLATGSQKIGVEITECVHEDDKRVQDKMEREGIDGPTFFPEYRVGEKRSNVEIEDIANNRHPKYPYMGDSLEENWMEAMICLTRKKALKFNLPQFSKYDNNWLLIHDNWSPYPYPWCYLDEVFVAQLYDSDGKNPFSKVFILTNQGNQNCNFVFEYCERKSPVKHGD